MSNIPLSTGFSAVLWLEEKKLNISQGEQLGVWDIWSNREVISPTFSQQEIINALGMEYFEFSFFGTDISEVMVFSNILDGEMKLYRDQETTVDTSKSLKAFIAAHKRLLSMLSEGTLRATGASTAVLHNADLELDKRPGKAPEEIRADLWRGKPIPHYNLSAFHLGPYQHPYAFEHCEKMGISEKDAAQIIATGAEFWISHIELDLDSFQRWYKPLLFKAFPSPTAATLRPRGKKIELQFGTDSLTSVKDYEGLKYIKNIITHSGPDGIAPSELTHLVLGDIGNHDDPPSHELNSHIYGHDAEFDQDDGGSIADLATNTSSIGSALGKNAKLLKSQIIQYWDHKEEIEANRDSLHTYNDDDASDLILKARTKIINKASSIDQSQKDNHAKVAPLIKSLLDTEPNLELLNEIFGGGNVAYEKQENLIRKNINYAIERLRDKCPHFCFHIGSLNDEEPGAIRVKSGKFVYSPETKVTWKMQR